MSNVPCNDMNMCSGDRYRSAAGPGVKGLALAGRGPGFRLGVRDFWGLGFKLAAGHLEFQVRLD